MPDNQQYLALIRDLLGMVCEGAFVDGYECEFDEASLMADETVKAAALASGFHHVDRLHVNPTVARELLRRDGANYTGRMDQPYRAACVCGWRGPIRARVMRDGDDPTAFGITQEERMKRHGRRPYHLVQADMDSHMQEASDGTR